MSSYIIDFNSNRITFLDNRFYLDEDKKFVPSVTTILQAYPKDYSFLKWLKENGEESDKIRDEAGKRGSIVHKLTENYDAGLEVSLLSESGDLNYRMDEFSMFEKYVQFSERFQPEILQSEQNYVSSALGYAGTIDRVIRMGGKTILMDIKTSNSLHDTYWLQLAAYRRLLQANAGVAVDEVGILWLNAKTRSEGRNGAVQGIGWQLVTEQNTDRYYELFQHTMALWKAQNKDAIPRNLTYQISHQKKQSI